jgi:pimeloyl-ACP methyl ester carboxylesterase
VSSITTVNGAELHYEVRGDGPPLLAIMGASGYGGVFDRFAELLADEFIVVTYDRRGNGRSPRPAAWAETSAEEQADDAAALLDALGLAPAAVFGTSSGGIFALAMAIHHPEAVRAAILHEPALFALFDDPAEVRDRATELIREGMAAGGPAAAFERFLRMVAGDHNWESLDAHLQRQLLASANTYFEFESGRFDEYVPEDAVLHSIAVPVELLVSEDSLPEFAQAAGRLGERLGVEITQTPGTHFPYLDHPEELARAVTELLQETVSKGA